MTTLFVALAIFHRGSSSAAVACSWYTPSVPWAPIGEPWPNNRGTEGGIVRLDEEHELGIRITLEESGYQPWSITCGIYGLMVHTAFASSEDEARAKVDRMKERPIGIAASDDPVPLLEPFVDEFRLDQPRGRRSPRPQALRFAAISPVALPSPTSFRAGT